MYSLLIFLTIFIFFDACIYFSCFNIKEIIYLLTYLLTPTRLNVSPTRLKVTTRFHGVTFNLVSETFNLVDAIFNLVGETFNLFNLENWG